MRLFIYGIIIGIAKVIPGVSGSLLAISLGIYEKTIHTLTHFFDNTKENIKYIIKLLLGILVGISLLSKIILYLLINYYFYSILLFIGLILSTIIKQIKEIRINIKVLVITILFTIIISNIPNIKINIDNDIVFFYGGIIEIVSSLIPGISGTSIFMSLGIYNKILELISNSININYIFNNIIKYIYFTIGMLISFIGCTILIDYLYKKHKDTFDNIVLGLSIGSLLLLFLLIYWPQNILNILLGLFLFILGIFIGLLL